MWNLSARIHGYIDYALVGLFVVAPTLLALRSVPAAVCYGLAAGHLALSVVTDYPLGAARVVPLRVHGAIELIAGVALVLLPWLLAPAAPGWGRGLFVAAGTIVCALWAVTRYAAPAPARPSYDRYDR